jgi:apolipoprotein N-acyltransferase
MMVNAAIWKIVFRGQGTEDRGQKYFIADMLFVVLSVIFVLGYGFFKLNLNPDPCTLNPVKISLIQGDIPQHQKWDENFRASILERYETLTKAAAKDEPDLIIWPETSAPGVIGEEPELLTGILDLAKEVKRPLLIGVVTSRDAHYYNSAILISPDSETLQQYDKLHLVPFGEYVPLERRFPFLRNLIGVPIGDFTSGKEYTIFKSQVTPRLRSGQASQKSQVRFSTLICFEDTIPEMSRKFVKNGAQFLVNITNDAWFMESSAPYQHAAASVFRAVENRVPVVRVANTGLSCFIDHYGRIYDKVSDGKKDIFVVGYKTGEIK